jgi:hypothetical protein
MVTDKDIVIIYGSYLPRMSLLIIPDTIIRNEFLPCTSCAKTCHLPKEVTHACALGKASLNWIRHIAP